MSLPSDQISAIVQAKDIVERSMSSLDFLHKLCLMASLDEDLTQELASLIKPEGLLHRLWDRLTELEESSFNKMRSARRRRGTSK